jgi:hypothetical protein
LSRKTHFWFYGKGEALASLAADLEIYGFSIDHWLSDPTGVVLSREMPVDLVSFRSTTPTILKAVEQSGVEYDGWETPVISQISTQSDGRVDH